MLNDLRNTCYVRQAENAYTQQEAFVFHVAREWEASTAKKVPFHSIYSVNLNFNLKARKQHKDQQGPCSFDSIECGVFQEHVTQYSLHKQHCTWESGAWVLTDSDALDSSGDDGCAKAGADARKDGGDEVLAAQDADDARARIEAHQRPRQNAGQRACRHDESSPWQPCALHKQDRISGQAQEMAPEKYISQSPVSCTLPPCSRPWESLKEMSYLQYPYACHEQQHVEGLFSLAQVSEPWGLLDQG